MDCKSKVSGIFKYRPNKIKVKIKIILNQIWFNSECYERNIIPKYANVNIKKSKQWQKGKNVQ